ncbi:MAG TPA: hypothetical protein VF167_16140 [Longimicrobiaceae bacterium]
MSKELLVPPLGIAVTRKASNDFPTAELVRDFVFYTADFDLQEAARIAGVSTATLTRWRMMGARQLRADVRRRLLKYVARREKEARARAAA